MHGSIRNAVLNNVATKQPKPHASKRAKRKRPTEIDTVFKLLRRSNGATIAQLQKVTEWQPHSVRAALTGLRKREGRIVMTGLASQIVEIQEMDLASLRQAWGRWHQTPPPRGAA